MVKYEFHALDVPGDGNCFFHCISEYLKLKHNEHVSHIELRDKTCRYMIRHAANLGRLFKKEEIPITPKDIVNIALAHRANGFFVDNELIQHATMACFNIKLRVYFGDKQSKCWNPCHVRIEDACNLLCENLHYRLMLVTNNQKTDEDRDNAKGKVGKT